MLWRIAFFVEGKQLEKCLAAVNGIALNMEPPKPVVNAVVKANKVEPASSASSKKEMMENWLRSLKGKEISVQAMKLKMTEFGGVATSLNSGLMQSFLKDKIIKRKGRGVYVAL